MPDTGGEYLIGLENDDEGREDMAPWLFLPAKSCLPSARNGKGKGNVEQAVHH